MPRQPKSPSLTQDLLMLGDIYLTIGWLAYQRLRHGPLWPWDARPAGRGANVLTLVRREEEAEQSREPVASGRG